MFIPSKPFLPLDVSDSRTITADCFPRQAIPAVVKLLIRRTYVSSWAEGQHELGRDMIVRCIVSLYAGCLNPTAEAVDRVYRLLSSALYGNVYAATEDSNNERIITPPIPDVPDTMGYAGESIIQRAKQATLAADNIATGIPNELFAESRNFRQQLDDIKTALQNGENLDADILAELVQIAGLLA